MAKKDMHTYVSRLKDTELVTLIATYDIPLDLRPRLHDPNFRMINLSARDTAIASSSRSEQVMSIHDFICMPSLDKATVQEDPLELGTSILGKVVDRTTSLVPADTDIPCASSEEIAVTRPDSNVLTKVDHAAKRKASTGPEISTDATKRTRSSKKASGAGSSEQAARDEVELTDDRTLDDDDQCDGPEFAMEGNESLHDVSPGSRTASGAAWGVRRTTRASFRAPYAPDTQPLDTDAGADDIASDGNVDSYFDARVSNTAGDVLERDLLPFVLGPYYIPYHFDEGSKSETALDRFPTPAEAHQLRELSSVELYNQMSVSRLKAKLGALKSKCEATKQKLNSWHKKHGKYRNKRDALALKKEKAEEELVGIKSQLEHHKRQAEEIQGSIASFFQSDFTPLV
ncbi:hypothetical protein Tco_0703745 [Tanacetum coccineum]|uniref:BZIP domain-containing protein n=1 Tax=Tanacetum coccineum TaxID=301880 RepID=A0ABQ4XZT3_9ASTR